MLDNTDTPNTNLQVSKTTLRFQTHHIFGTQNIVHVLSPKQEQLANSYTNLISFKDRTQTSLADDTLDTSKNEESMYISKWSNTSQTNLKEPVEIKKQLLVLGTNIHSESKINNILKLND